MTKRELIKILQEHNSPDGIIVKCYDGTLYEYNEQFQIKLIGILFPRIEK